MPAAIELKGIQAYLKALNKLEQVADSYPAARNFLSHDYDKNLQRLKEAEKRLKTRQSKPERGRKPNVGARSLSLYLAQTYFALTGQKPTRRTDYNTGKYYGPFVEFVEACFKLAGLDAAPHEYARFAASNFEESKGVNPPD